MSIASGWEKWADWHEGEQHTTVAWLCRSAGIAPGMTVVDLACGVGMPAIEIARRVGANGRVIACDVDAEMLAACNRRARVANVELDLRELDMQDLRGIADSSVDAVTSSFALMFCPDPVKVMTEIRRVLKPDARFALSVWSEAAKNPFFTTIFAAVTKLMPSPPAVFGAPGPFRLGPPGELERVARAAGFTDLAFEELPFEYQFDSLDHHWQVMSAMATPVKRAAETLPASEVEQLRRAIADAVAPYKVGDKLRIPATPALATGRK